MAFQVLWLRTDSYEPPALLRFGENKLHLWKKVYVQFLGPFRMESACSFYVLSRSALVLQVFSFLPQSKNIHVSWIQNCTTHNLGSGKFKLNETVCLHDLNSESLHTNVLLAPVISSDSATFAASFSFSQTSVCLCPLVIPLQPALFTGRGVAAASGFLPREINLTPMISASRGGCFLWVGCFFVCFSFHPATAPKRCCRLLILQLEHSWCSRRCTSSLKHATLGLPDKLELRTNK